VSEASSVHRAEVLTARTDVAAEAAEAAAAEAAAAEAAAAEAAATVKLPPPRKLPSPRGALRKPPPMRLAHERH
jgi:hypothetical protein